MFQVIYELTNGEQQFVKDLHFIVSVYYHPMHVLGIVSKEDQVLCLVFGCVTDAPRPICSATSLS
jgi:hypothetical protein